MITKISQSEVDYVSPMVQLVSKLLQNHGEKHTLRLLKSYRVFLSQTLLKQDVIPLSFHRVDRDMFPVVLGP